MEAESEAQWLVRCDSGAVSQKESGLHKFHLETDAKRVKQPDLALVEGAIISLRPFRRISAISACAYR